MKIRKYSKVRSKRRSKVRSKRRSKVRSKRRSKVHSKVRSKRHYKAHFRKDNGLIFSSDIIPEISSEEQEKMKIKIRYYRRRVKNIEDIVRELIFLAQKYRIKVNEKLPFYKYYNLRNEITKNLVNVIHEYYPNITNINIHQIDGRNYTVTFKTIAENVLGRKLV